MSHVLTLELDIDNQGKSRERKAVELDIDDIKAVRSKPSAVEIVKKGFPEKRMAWLPVTSARKSQLLADKIERALNPTVNLNEFK